MRAEWQLSSGTELRIANGMERCVYSVVGAVHNRYGGTWEGAKGALLSAVQVGGAINLWSGSNIKLSSCTLSGNQATLGVPMKCVHMVGAVHG